MPGENLSIENVIEFEIEKDIELSYPYSYINRYNHVLEIS
jgi:hypothetical protein